MATQDLADDYSIWALECANFFDYPDSALLFGTTEGSRTIPVNYWLIQGRGRNILVDAGFTDTQWSLGMFDTYDVRDFKTPDHVLSRVEIKPEDIDSILITHHHFDHISGVRYFPNANIYIQAREVANWFEKWGTPEHLKWLIGGLNPDTATDLALIAGEGRLRPIHGKFEVAPGVSLHPAYDTHTAGSQYVTVARSDGAPWVFAGDIAYLYENLGGLEGGGQHIPVGFGQGNQERLVRTTDEMLTVAGGDIHLVLPAHDALLWDIFPSTQFEDGLHMAEISLAPGVASRLD